MENAKDAFQTQAITKHMRQTSKSLVHATNYYGTPGGIAKKLGLRKFQVENFQARWFKIHPAIKAWHEKVKLDLQMTRTTYNILGFRRIWFDRIESLLPEALAWIGQSTTALVINTGMQNCSRISDVVPIMQVHDSFLFQVLRSRVRYTLPLVRKAMEIPLPYPRPLIIPTTLKLSEISWGQMKDVPWDSCSDYPS